MPNQVDYDLKQKPGYRAGSADMRGKSGRTLIASRYLNFGDALQRLGDRQCTVLVPGGKFIGIAEARHFAAGSDSVDIYDQYDNVSVADSGPYFHIADAAFSAGAGLNWNSATSRWTNAAASGNVVSTPGVEAVTASTGNGAPITILLRRS